MTKADQIRQQIKLKRKQLGYYASFIKNPITNMLFKEISELNLQLSSEIEKETVIPQKPDSTHEKSFDEDAKEIDDAQRLRDLKS